MFQKHCIALFFLTLLAVPAWSQTAAVTTTASDSIAYPLYADCPQVPNKVYKTNPFVVLWGPIPFTSEFRFVNEVTTGQHSTAEFGVSYLGKSPILKSIEDSLSVQSAFPIKFKVQGIRFQLAYKFYLNKLFPRLRYAGPFSPGGFWIGPHFSYSSAKITNRYLSNYDIYAQGTHVNFNLLAGRQMIISDTFVLDVFAGLGYKKNTWITNDATTNSQQSLTDDLPEFYTGPIKISLGFNVGIAF